jgi:aminopeptidase N
VDKKQYLYTQFESYFANRVLAQFDQPDLKAKMRLNIICPKIWKVLSNEYAHLEEDFNAEKYVSSTRTSHKELLSAFVAGKEGKMTLFPDTKLLPTYLYCFIAGEYKELVLEEAKRYNVLIYLILEHPNVTLLHRVPL